MAPELVETGSLVVELPAALTPERAAGALHHLPALVLLDSSRPDGDRGRYSYLTADPFLTLRSRGREVELTGHAAHPFSALGSRDREIELARHATHPFSALHSRGREVEPTGHATQRRWEADPFAVLQELVRRYHVPALAELPPFQGGVAGYFGYDLGRQVERLPSIAVDDLGLPELQVGFYDWVVAWDHVRGRSWLIATGLPSRSPVAARARVEQILADLHAGRGVGEDGPVPLPAAGRLRSNFRRAQYLAAIDRAQESIAAGEIYQVNLSQRFAGPWAGDPWALYRRLRAVSPAPYSAYLRFGDLAVLSASPECFLRCHRQRHRQDDGQGPSKGRFVALPPSPGAEPPGYSYEAGSSRLPAGPAHQEGTSASFVGAAGAPLAAAPSLRYVPRRAAGSGKPTPESRQAPGEGWGDAWGQGWGQGWSQVVETHPIKGTRPRGATPVEDAQLAAELRASEKDRAENLMIVDLLRNDLGRVCRTGSIRVPRLWDLEGYSHVWQMVSTITGELPGDRDAVDLLRACFPGGSVTGCPKIRAMAIIDELERVRRGIYCGAIGYLAFGGAMETSIVIRTLILKDGWLYLQVGGAVVADSDPQAEYDETLAKAAGALAALGAGVDTT